MKKLLVIAVLLLVSATVIGWEYQESVDPMTDVVTKGIVSYAQDYSGAFRKPYMAILSQDGVMTVAIEFNSYSIKTGERAIAYRIGENAAKTAPMQASGSLVFLSNSDIFLAEMLEGNRLVVQARHIDGSVTAIFNLSQFAAAFELLQ